MLFQEEMDIKSFLQNMLTFLFCQYLCQVNELTNLKHLERILLIILYNDVHTMKSNSKVHSSFASIYINPVIN